MRKIAIIAIIAIISLWLGGLISFIQKIPDTPQTISGNYDSIIVLTGGQGRIDAGIELQKSLSEIPMLISGVFPDANLEKVFHFNDAPTTFGMLARTTKGNAIEAKEWIEKHKFNSIILVTASYHMPRSISIFKREMPHLKILPMPVFPNDFNKNNWYKNWNSARLILTEYNKYLATF